MGIALIEDEMVFNFYRADVQKPEISCQTQGLSKVGLFWRSLIPNHDKRESISTKKFQSHILNVKAS